MTTTRDTSAHASAGFWGSYAIGIIDELDFGPDIVAYLEGIEATLAPLGGAFLVHGGWWEQVEGDPVGAPVVIAFPDRDGAGRWYRSEAYQRIAGLRAAHSVSRIIVTEGVDADHRSTDILDLLAGVGPGPGGGAQAGA